MDLQRPQQPSKTSCASSTPLISSIGSSPPTPMSSSNFRLQISSPANQSYYDNVHSTSPDIPARETIFSPSPSIDNTFNVTGYKYAPGTNESRSGMHSNSLLSAHGSGTVLAGFSDSPNDITNGEMAQITPVPVQTSTMVRTVTSNSNFLQMVRGMDAWTYAMPTTANSSGNALSGSDSTTGLMCRICHEGESKGYLISPCKCTGTMGMMHRTCIEQWLGSSNTNKCEICDYGYQTERTYRPFTAWLENPSRPSDKRNLVGDLICFMLLTPLAAVSAWLCITGAYNFAKYKDGAGTWETVGLIVLSVFLVLIYLVWCVIAIRYHARVFLEWRSKNPVVRVVDRSVVTSGDNMDNNNSTVFLRHVTSMPDILQSPVTPVSSSTHCMQHPGNITRTSLSDTFVALARSRPQYQYRKLVKETCV